MKTLEQLSQDLKIFHQNEKIKITNEIKQWISEFSMIEPNENEIQKYLEIFDELLRNIESKEFTEQLTLFYQDEGKPIVLKLIEFTKKDGMELESICLLISCLAFVTNNNYKTKEFLFENGIIDGVQQLLIHPQILVVFENLFEKHEFQTKVTKQFTNSEFVIALLSALLTLIMNCEEIQIEMIDRGIVELLCNLLENTLQSPKELSTVYAIIITLIDNYVEKLLDRIPNKIVEILIDIAFKSDVTGIRIIALKSLINIANQKRQRFRNKFIDTIFSIKQIYLNESNESIKQSSLLLMKSICDDKENESCNFLSHVNNLIEIAETEKDTSICAIEVLNSIAMRDDCLSFISSKIDEFVKILKKSNGNKYGSMTILLATMGRTDDVIKMYRHYNVAQVLIEYVNEHLSDEHSMLMSLNVLNEISVMHDNRDYLVDEIKIYEVLLNWYKHSTNQVIIFYNQQLISRLLLHGTERIDKFMQVDGLLESIIETATYNVRLIKEKRTAETATRQVRDVRVAFEATRMLCNIINYKSEYAYKIIQNEFSLYAINELVHSHYDILKTEGRTTLQLLVKYELVTEDQLKYVEEHRI